MKMKYHSVAVAPNGRMVLPANLRERLSLRHGGTLVIAEDDGQITLETLEQSVRRAQEIVRRHATSMEGAVDELIEERRAEAAREDAE